MKPFVTPMVERAFVWACSLVSDGHAGGVIYAPTRTGKSTTIELLVTDLRSFTDSCCESFESETVAIEAEDRLVMSEGGFWEWALRKFEHAQARKHLSPSVKRDLVYEYVKGLASRSPSGRLIMFVDEAQILDLTELGWFADLFNNVRKDGFEFILILVGSYHLHEWIKELNGKRHEHVRSRFFAMEHRLTGLISLEDFRRCLRRFDTDTSAIDGRHSITEHFQPKWFNAGGRLEKRADFIRNGFMEVLGKPIEAFEVRMEYFALAVRYILRHGEHNCDATRLAAIINDTGIGIATDVSL